MTRRIPTALTLLILIASTASAQLDSHLEQHPVPHVDRYVVYVSHNNRLSHFDMNPKTGALIPTGSVMVGASPGCIAIHPNQKVLYVSVRNGVHLAGYNINPRSGALSLINQVDIPSRAAYISVDQTGRWLLTAHYAEDYIAVHRLREDGSIDPAVHQRFDTKDRPHCIRVSPDNRTVLVPNTGGQVVMQFAFDAVTGRLTPKDPLGAFSDGDGAQVVGPRHIWFHPTAPFAYTSNEQGSSVTAYRFNAATNTVARFQTLSTLPADYKEKNSTSDIEVTPDGRFVFVANRGHNSVATFAVDIETGRLTSVGHIPVDAVPRSFNVDPTSNFLYVAGQRTGKLKAFRLNPKDASATHLGTYNVPNDPSWVHVQKMPQHTNTNPVTDTR
ncbi:MAG: lactonase family protein [Planctomycetota bacterium]